MAKAISRRGANSDDAALIALYREYSESVELRLFSPAFRKQLARELGNPDHVALIEAACEIGSYHDRNLHAAHRRAVLKMLTERRIKHGRGGKNPALVSFVRKVAQLLECLGWKIKSGETSAITLLLGLVAAELNLEGDPRGELRIMVRERRASQAASKAAIDDMLARVFQHLAPPVRVDPS